MTQHVRVVHLFLLDGYWLANATDRAEIFARVTDQCGDTAQQSFLPGRNGKEERGSSREDSACLLALQSITQYINPFMTEFFVHIYFFICNLEI